MKSPVLNHEWEKAYESTTGKTDQTLVTDKSTHRVSYKCLTRGGVTVAATSSANIDYPTHYATL